MKWLIFCLLFLGLIFTSFFSVIINRNDGYLGLIYFGEVLICMVLAVACLVKFQEYVEELNG